MYVKATAAVIAVNSATVETWPSKGVTMKPLFVASITSPVGGNIYELEEE